MYEQDDDREQVWLVKFEVVSGIVWVCLKGMITEKALKEE